MHPQSLMPWNWFEREGNVPKRHLCLGRYPESPVRADFILSDMDSFTKKVFGTMFSDFIRGGQPPRVGDQSVQTPKMDISGDDKQYTIQLELPGIEEKDLNVEIRERLLTISAEKKCDCAKPAEGEKSTAEKENKEQEGADKSRKGYYCQERSYGYFQRALTLPEDADTEKLDAKFKNGVLHLTIPRKEPAAEPKAKRIAISTE